MIAYVLGNGHIIKNKNKDGSGLYSFEYLNWTNNRYYRWNEPTRKFPKKISEEATFRWTFVGGVDPFFLEGAVWISFDNVHSFLQFLSERKYDPRLLEFLTNEFV